MQWPFFFFRNAADAYTAVPFLALQISWVMVPMGQ